MTYITYMIYLSCNNKTTMKLKRINLKLEEGLHKKLRLKVLKEDTDLQAKLVELVKEYLSK